MNTDTFVQFRDLVQSRYSCRAYAPTPVDRGVICSVLETARLAPSACNRQPWKFIVVDDEESRRIIASAYSREWIVEAPAYIIACGDHNEAWHRGTDDKDHTDVDVAIAVEHICLAATSLELGTCWVCNFDADIIRKKFDIPEGIEPIAIIPIGYPVEDAIVPKKNRKALDEIAKWGKM